LNGFCGTHVLPFSAHNNAGQLRGWTAPPDSSPGSISHAVPLSLKDRREERQTRKGVEGENGKIATLPVQAAFVHACADQLWPQPCRGVQFCP
jgi:hypothetical protein